MMIHNKEIKNEFHYDYEKVIVEVQNLRGLTQDETSNNLCMDGILSPLPNGEYKVEVGTSTKGGGGLNYHGVAFFLLSNKDYQTKYYELAHSLQNLERQKCKEEVQKRTQTSQQKETLQFTNTAASR